MCGTAAAASSRSTVMRTSSEPARASAATWRAVPSMSAVSVLVMDWTTTGAPPPTVTSPTRTGTVLCRGSGPARSLIDRLPRMFVQDISPPTGCNNRKDRVNEDPALMPPVFDPLTSIDYAAPEC